MDYVKRAVIEGKDQVNEGRKLNFNTERVKLIRAVIS